MQTSFARGPFGTKFKGNTESYMAIYHLSVKTISRSAGRSATAAAAYRSGCLISDDRTGAVFDYRRKRGIESVDLVLPLCAPEWAFNRALLWNAAEISETRKNSTVAREFEIALPEELSADDRKRLALNFARELVARHGCAADVAIHAPSKNGDNRNHHAHILCSTRRLTTRGFREKTRELDNQKSREVDRWRQRFAELQNAYLQESGSNYIVDHRSLSKQGINRPPTTHNGTALTAILRRGGPSSVEKNREIEKVENVAYLAKLKNHSHEINTKIILLSTDLQSAIAELEQINANTLIDSIRSVSSLLEANHMTDLDNDELDDSNDESEQIYRPY
ncbi:MAG: MobQ family relaxase [Herminiimonas sp.]|uniref:MobQ family relaxase n=1 Tax=Herminiimonas sp. TaxID=1926289 RepID=UPI002727D91F|nr:MobQ family relaxase [Herminiimonas sp.]MDO9420422.1 MobQ family relaxase [Herminiimonas sp.]